LIALPTSLQVTIFSYRSIFSLVRPGILGGQATDTHASALVYSGQYFGCNTSLSPLNCLSTQYRNNSRFVGSLLSVLLRLLTSRGNRFVCFGSHE